MKEGRLVPPEKYLAPIQGRTFRSSHVSPPGLERCLRDGATLVVDSLDWLHAPLGQLARNLERDLGVDVHVNGYAGWREATGLDLHWDRHDVMVLQASGRKLWHVYEPTRRFPLASDTAPNEKPDGDPACVLTLSAGDVLYIPRGWWHVAVPCGEPTLHLTVGLRGRTALDLMTWLVHGDLAQQEIMREDIPSQKGASDRGAYLERVRAAVAGVCSHGDLLDRFLRHTTASARPRPRMGLPFAATERVLPESDAYLICSMLPRRGAIIQSGDGPVEVDFAGATYTFAPECRSPLEYLDAGYPAQIRKFYETFEPQLGDERLTQLLLDLATAGIIALQEPLGEAGPGQRHGG
jgi:hypothetical protein